MNKILICDLLGRLLLEQKFNGNKILVVVRRVEKSSFVIIRVEFENGQNLTRKWKWH
jgi:hypothetical protein